MRKKLTRTQIEEIVRAKLKDKLSEQADQRQRSGMGEITPEDIARLQQVQAQIETPPSIEMRDPTPERQGIEIPGPTPIRPPDMAPPQRPGEAPEPGPGRSIPVDPRKYGYEVPPEWVPEAGQQMVPPGVQGLPKGFPERRPGAPGNEPGNRDVPVMPEEGLREDSGLGQALASAMLGGASDDQLLGMQSALQEGNLDEDAGMWLANKIGVVGDKDYSNWKKEQQMQKQNKVNLGTSPDQIRQGTGRQRQMQQIDDDVTESKEALKNQIREFVVNNLSGLLEGGAAARKGNEGHDQGKNRMLPDRIHEEEVDEEVELEEGGAAARKGNEGHDQGKNRMLPDRIHEEEDEGADDDQGMPTRRQRRRRDRDYERAKRATAIERGGGGKEGRKAWRAQKKAEKTFTAMMKDDKKKKKETGEQSEVNESTNKEWYDNQLFEALSRKWTK